MANFVRSLKWPHFQDIAIPSWFEISTVRVIPWVSTKKAMGKGWTLVFRMAREGLRPPLPFLESLSSLADEQQYQVWRLLGFPLGRGQGKQEGIDPGGSLIKTDNCQHPV